MKKKKYIYIYMHNPSTQPYPCDLGWVGFYTYDRLGCVDNFSIQQIWVGFKNSPTQPDPRTPRSSQFFTKLNIIPITFNPIKIKGNGWINYNKIWHRINARKQELKITTLSLLIFCNIYLWVMVYLDIVCVSTFEFILQITHVLGLIFFLRKNDNFLF